jgi:protein-S-isoprenylcysteine O-methyltransferase Ste14
LALLLIFWQWRPLPAVVWSAGHPAVKVVLWALFGLGWGIMAASTCFIDHRDLFGLRQVEHYRQDRAYSAPRFQTPALYRYVRHPIYLGFTMAFCAAPVMTVGHALFAAAATAYILAGIQLEERDLVRAHGEAYEQYRREVPMLLPVPRRR